MLAWFVLRPLAVMSILLGMLSIPTPFPIGGVLIIFGIGLFVMTSSWARRMMRAARTRFGWVDGWISLMENRLGRRIGVFLRRTRPIRRPSG